MVSLPSRASRSSRHRCLPRLSSYLLMLGQRRCRAQHIPDRQRKPILTLASYRWMLRKNDKNGPSEELQAFYEMVEESTLVWINQPEPRGLGDAILKAKPFIGGDSFLVHAGDSYILSENSKHLKRLTEVSDMMKADAAFLVQQVEDP